MDKTLEVYLPNVLVVCPKDLIGNKKHLRDYVLY